MFYTTLIAISIVTISGSARIVRAQGNCDTFGGVMRWHRDCKRSVTSNQPAFSDIVSGLAALCSVQQEYEDCVRTKALENSCGNIAAIRDTVTNMMSFCVDGAVADWVTDNAAAGRFDQNLENCTRGAEDGTMKCVRDAIAKTSSYGNTIRDTPLAAGLAEIERFKETLFPCSQSAIADAFPEPLGPDCGSATWQEVYNMFVLYIAAKLPFAVQVHEDDIISLNGANDVKRGFELPWRR